MTSVPTPIPSRTQFVLEGIKHRILTGQLTPGQALVETELAAQFGVSKTPVREALKTLAGTGLVVMSQYKGVTVRMVDADMAREVYDVRLLLEPEALRRSVRRGAPWDAAADALTRADEATDTAERSLANREFHRALYVPCGNPLLGRMLDEVRDQAALVSAVAWAADPSWEREAAEHREILRLALDGDADGAAAALHAHIASFVERAFPGAREDEQASVPRRPQQNR
ncbi:MULTISPECIES: GntR family transcriptional regulator [Streptomyces]|uniref:DNA-binding GntR family transcriptional regulator n=1 Tax=Streptomyces stelliscabiei TaxID=146820 RepID=A0A8I0P516_9ACTN|nr:MULTISPECIES: GntR family transcriptional regulator [Streptomyces]KND44844.1 GntR family transcriptional regulator [Streptomyces stelliscabiei]MBE1596160.1 DNA-binding GntR family transcriptional regulator [Streptomyces stelliscabiei]MDX2519700.1 GntR family transcriptional regulator [Streptomyces stelliscabiei]MDX2556685.1 GntR family transcriptional regulator [Streptomyces stelliscabiei]MDX2615688.1 GntR family transcriptional regulator [Streptomyces stelliscabiei]